MFLKKHKNTVFPTLSVSAVVHFYAYQRPEKQVSMIRKYHNHKLQPKTRPGIIMNFIQQRNQFLFERKLYAQKCVSVSVPFVLNVVVEHVSGFVVCCVETTHYNWKVPSYLWVMWHTMLVSVHAISVLL